MSHKYSKYLYGLILGLVLYSIFLRLYHLGVQSFWIDEGFSSYSTLAWTNTEYLLHNLSQWASFQIFGISDWSARLPSVIFSILTIPLLFILSEKLFQDKRISILTVLIFCFFYLEITWARQARFYTLLQFLFYLNIYLSVKVYENFSLENIGLALILLGISMSFHPFLWVNIIILGSISLYKIYSSKILSARSGMIVGGLTILASLGLYFLSSVGNWITRSQSLSPETIQNYINFYLSHLLAESGWLYVFFIMSFFIFLLKKDVLKTIIFTGGFLIAFYVISQKGYLFHTRYVFFLFPLIFMGGLYSYVFLGDCIKNIYGKSAYFISIGAILYISMHLSFTPQTYYGLDFTSPQVDFKSAYNSLPDDAQVVSGFPMMCEWYYRDEGDCEYAVAVNYVGSEQSGKNILEGGKDNYTGTPYLLSLEQLETGREYYFVLDDLSQRRIISRELHKEVLEKGEIHYNSGTSYRNIQIIKLKL